MEFDDNLFTARARLSDPSPSHEAAHDVEASGRAANQRALCFSVVRESPGLTAAEIAERADLERHVPSRRLPELREAGLVVNGEIRVCRVGNRNSMTWFVAPELK